MQQWEYLQVNFENISKWVEGKRGWEGHEFEDKRVWFDSQGRVAPMPRHVHVLEVVRDKKGREVKRVIGGHDDDYSQLLYELGTEGWELVSTLTYVSSGSGGVCGFIFKRPKQ